jgi:SOS response regulatory protein OraA/RecX
VPVDAVVAAGLSVGVELDRERARLLNRALRRQRALDTAGRILRASDQTRAGLSERLAGRGVREPDRQAVVEAFVAAAIVDDGRFARARAALLARRELGDEGIRAELEGRGIPDSLIDDALAELEPESARLAQIFERDGVTQRAATRLSRRGFDDASLEPFLSRLADGCWDGAFEQDDGETRRAAGDALT